VAFNPLWGNSKKKQDGSSVFTFIVIEDSFDAVMN